MIAGFNVNTVLKCGWTPLMYAVSSAFPQITKFLLDNGADPHGHKGKNISMETVTLLLFLQFIRIFFSFIVVSNTMES